MPYARSFRQLKVYETAFETAHALFECSKRFPTVERYALTDQARRSSRAVCALIAEAWYHRPYPKAFVSKLVQALGESAETQVWLDFAARSGYITAEEHARFDEAFDHIGAMLYRMLTRPHLFSGRQNLDETQE